MISTIISSLQNSKSKNIKFFRNEKFYFSIVILASGTSINHVDGIFDNLLKVTKKNNISFIVSGRKTEWIILAHYELVVHIMTESYRDYYDIDSLYQN